MTYIWEVLRRSPRVAARPTIRGFCMWNQIERALGPMFRCCQNLDRHEWIAVFAVALFLGYLCMRGFGSRANY